MIDGGAGKRGKGDEIDDNNDSGSQDFVMGLSKRKHNIAGRNKVSLMRHWIGQTQEIKR